MRAMFDANKWSNDNEREIVKVRNELIGFFLSLGKDVIVDDTNLNPIHENNIRDRFGHLAEIKVKFFDTPLEECITRNANRSNAVPVEVIRDMYDKWIKNERYLQTKVGVNNLSFEPYVPNKYLPSAVIVDIDGTLADSSGRSPYDLSKVGEDIPIKSVVNLIEHIRMGPFLENKIILMSGRDKSSFDATTAWLKKHDIPYDELLMRPEGDRRPDYLIKYELFNQEVRNKYNVLWVIDDRKSVKRMWNQLGLFVLDVNQNDEIF